MSGSPPRPSVDDVMAMVGGDVDSEIIRPPPPAAGPAPAPDWQPGQAGTLSGSDWAGFRIGPLLGSGGMGEVYRAWQPSLSREVALKVLSAGTETDPERRLRFAAEARAAGRLRSPHVVAVFASGEEAGRLWLALELVSGCSLGDELRRRRESGHGFSPLEAARLVLQAAEGLGAAHRERLVHRDVKPGNILLAADGVVKITDFGLVRFLDERHLTVTGTILGTPLYLAPEQGRGLGADARSDVYGLGAVLYELLTLTPPFDGSTAEELVSQHNFAEPVLPSRLNPDIPRDLEAVVLKCLQKDPDARYADAGVLASDLARVVVGMAPLSAIFGPGGLSTGAAEAVRRLAGRRRWLPAAALAVLALLLAAGWWWWDARKDALQRLRTRLEPLAHATAIPGTASSDLDGLQQLAGAQDPQVVQGRAKLEAVATLGGRLEADLSGLGERERIAAWHAALEALSAEVGEGGDPRWPRWSARLAEAGARVETLRMGLSRRRAGVEVLDDRQRAEAAAELAAYRSLVAADDAEVRAWDDLLRRSGLARDAALAAAGRLAPPGAIPPEADTILDALQRLVGPEDPGLRRHRERIAEQRALEPILDGWQARPMLDATAADAATVALARYRSLAGEDGRALRAAARLAQLLGPPPPAWSSAHGSDGHGPWLELRIGDERLRLRWLPPGACRLGSAPDEPGHESDETRAEATLLRGRWVADRECSQALWRAVMDTAPSRHDDARCPVDRVSRRDAEAFCARLGVLLPGCRARLPSEAEWEAMARAGSDGPWAGWDRATAAACIVHGRSASEAGGSRPANALGIHDAAGSVWEWCAGAYGPAPAGPGADDPARLDGTGVIRGGSWDDPLEKCRPANRAALDPDARSPIVGFRCVVDP